MSCWITPVMRRAIGPFTLRMKDATRQGPSFLLIHPRIRSVQGGERGSLRNHLTAIHREPDLFSRAGRGDRRRDGHLDRDGRPALPRLPGDGTGRTSTTFEEVAYLLLHGELPTARQLADFQQAHGRRPPDCPAAARLAPDAAALDGPRWTPCAPPSACWRTSTRTPTTIARANLRKAERLLGQIPVAVADHYRLSKGLNTPVPPRADLSHAANFLYMLRGVEPPRRDVRGPGRVADPVRRARVQRLDVHGPGGASRRSRTCTRRSSAAIGALKGRLHGGANEKVMDMLRGGGRAGRRRRSGCARRWRARSGSWASATASTRRATCAPGS